MHRGHGGHNAGELPLAPTLHVYTITDNNLVNHRNAPSRSCRGDWKVARNTHIADTLDVTRASFHSPLHCMCQQCHVDYCASALPACVVILLKRKRGCAIAQPLVMYTGAGCYQITTCSEAGRYILSPSLMPNASKKGVMLRRVTFTRFSPRE